MHNTIASQFRLVKGYTHRHLKFDFVAAIVVFLVAIPLCLGIALASGTPLFSGIISGIVGGIVVGIFSGSQVSVSGPAAGLAAVVLAAGIQLGDFNTLLLAIVLCGVMQLMLGYLKAGFIIEYVPSNVVQGLLCAIGILLIIKQLPLAFSSAANISEFQSNLLDATEGFSLKPLQNLSQHINSGAAIISIISLTILTVHEKINVNYIRSIPSSIIVVLVGILINEEFLLTHSQHLQTNPQLVNIPEHSGLLDLIKQLQFPNWQALINIKVYIYAIIIAIVASLESLLNVKAGEKLDKKKRYCSKDQELIAQGLGNITAGLIGGIPITSVIVRTSVNIQTGAKTKMSAIMHGFLLLFAVLLIPGLLNKIPIASLAIILIFIGYKLTKPAIFKTIYNQGWDRFIPFIATVIGIVMLNLLVGILIGLAISLFYILKTNSQARLDIVTEVYPNGTINRLLLPQQITFLNKASLVAELAAIPRASQLIIDARYSRYIDKEIIELIKDFQIEQAAHKEISLNLIGFKEHYDIHNFIDFINVTTYDVQANLSPQDVLVLLREGNERFIKDKRIHRSPQIDIHYTAKTQHPIGIVLGCVDSRVPVETIFDMGFGDLFCARIAGNVVNDDILASMEFACGVAGAKLIVVLGHTRCGAIQAACNQVEQGHLTQLLAKIKPAINAEATIQEDRTGQNSDFTSKVTQLNIANTLNQIYQKSESLQLLIDQDAIAIVGATYDVETGKVHFSTYRQQLAQLTQELDNPLNAKMHALLANNP